MLKLIKVRGQIDSVIVLLKRGKIIKSNDLQPIQISGYVETSSFASRCYDRLGNVMRVSIANALILFNLAVTFLMTMSVAVLIYPQVHSGTRDQLSGFLCQFHATKSVSLVETIRQGVEVLCVDNNVIDNFTRIAVFIDPVGRKRQDVIPEFS